MEEIPYRNTKLLVQTIPKGTLLFRLTKDPDTRGVPLKDGTRCIIPNFNVYFYPTPFVMKHAAGKYQAQLMKGKKMYAYVLTKDVKVIRLLLPSKYARQHKGTKRNFIKRCSNVPKGCMPNELNFRDPCLSDTIVEKYPEIVGMMGVAVYDAYVVNKSLSHKRTKKVRRFFSLATDAEGTTGIPELVLHPLHKRPSKQIIVNPTDKLEMNYKLIKPLSFNESELINFMDKHATFNPETLYYTYTA